MGRGRAAPTSHQVIIQYVHAFVEEAGLIKDFEDEFRDILLSSQNAAHDRSRNFVFLVSSCLLVVVFTKTCTVWAVDRELGRDRPTSLRTKIKQMNSNLNLKQTKYNRNKNKSNT
jgi:hypothetical protein